MKDTAPCVPTRRRPCVGRDETNSLSGASVYLLGLRRAPMRTYGLGLVYARRMYHQWYGCDVRTYIPYNYWHDVRPNHPSTQTWFSHHPEERGFASLAPISISILPKPFWNNMTLKDLVISAVIYQLFSSHYTCLMGHPSLPRKSLACDDNNRLHYDLMKLLICSWWHDNNQNIFTWNILHSMYK